VKGRESTELGEGLRGSEGDGAHVATLPPEPAAGAAGTVPAGWRRTFSSLRIVPYRWLWSGMLAYFLAMQMDTFARGYLAYDLTGAATALGLVWVAWGVPMLLLSLVAGVVADRVEKRNMLLVVQAGMGVLALVTAVLVHTGVIDIWQMVALGVGQGVVWAFAVPARMALLPELVGDEELTNALALNNAAMNGTRIVGPALAGGFIAIPFIGIQGVFYLMVLLYVVVGLTLLPIPRTGTPARQEAPLWQEMGAGLRYVGSRRDLVILMLMGFVPILLGMSYAALLPVFAKDVHGVGSVGFGLMGAFVGVGAIVGSLVIAYFSDYPHRATLQLVLGVGFGLALFVFAEAPSYGVALAALALVGFTFNSYMTLNNSLIFSQIEPGFYGRVMSVYMLSWSLMPLVTLPMAGLADTIGAPTTVAAAGLIIAVFIGAVAVLYPGYRAIGTGAVPAGERRQAGG
jgi:MFS family permease